MTEHNGPKTGSSTYLTDMRLSEYCLVFSVIDIMGVGKDTDRCDDSRDQTEEQDET